MTFIINSVCLVIGLLLGVIYFLVRQSNLKKEGIESAIKLQTTQERLDKQNDELTDLRDKKTELQGLLGNRDAQIEALKQQLANQKDEIQALQDQLTKEFENIANRILKERSLEWNLQSEKSLGALLTPLGQRIEDFKKQVDEAFRLEMRDKISLKEEVRQLADLNSRVSQEANNLTKALKGDVKQQGNWGEMILERVLETSGLTKGIEYDREVVVQGVDGNTQRPDVIIYLPENKHIIVDSKVSLTAYERMVNAPNEEEYQRALSEHIVSLKKHVKELSDKNYTGAATLHSPDFVLMFVPIEASFSSALQADDQLFRYAWDNKIIIVSPTTLLATLRTVASVWQHEKQTKNALEIARLSGAMYDKLSGFVGDMKKIKEQVIKAESAVDDAMRKLSDGQGNVLRTAQRIIDLGAKHSKELPSDLLE